MATVNRTCFFFSILLISSMGMACSDKKEKTTYDEIESTDIIKEDSNFEIDISNPNLMTLQKVRFTGKRIGDFYKIESQNFKVAQSDSTMLLSKSYLIDASKFEQVQNLIKQRVSDNTEKMIFSDTNPVIININLDAKEGKMRKELDVDAAVIFEIALFKLLDGETAVAPQAVKIPTH